MFLRLFTRAYPILARRMAQRQSAAVVLQLPHFAEPEHEHLLRLGYLPTNCYRNLYQTEN